MRYPSLLQFTSASEVNSLEDEFLQYQLLEKSHIEDNVWQAALVVDDESSQHHRLDKVWAHLSQMRTPDNSLMFNKLSKVALLVLTLPHSNAEEERIFSMITKNKSKFRPSLKLDGTLSSILTIKCAGIEPCHTYDSPVEVLETAKKATMTYNCSHKNCYIVLFETYALRIKKNFY